MASILYMAIGLLAFLSAAALLFSLHSATRVRRLQEELRIQTLRNDGKDRALQEQRSAVARANAELVSLSDLLLLLPDLAERLSSSHTARELEEAVVLMTKQWLDAEQVSFFAAEDNALLLKVSTGLNPDQQKAVQKIPIGQGRIGWTAEKQVVMFDEDFRRESNLAKQAFTSKSSVKSDLCVPLVHRQRLYGVINVGGFSRRENARRIINMITNLSMIALENLVLLEETRQTANLDSLTKLYNLTYCYKQLEREIQKAQRYNRPLTVVLLDIDHLDSYNRAFGRLEGDNVLRVVANLVKDSLRTVDIPCRYGGEQYAILLPETDKEKGLFVAERARKLIEAHAFSLRKITVSGGIATYPEDGKDTAGLLKEAEEALKAAKARGRNRIKTASQEV